MHSTVFKPSVLTSQAFSVIDYLNLNSKLDFEMNLNLDEPAFPGAAKLAPVATSSCRGRLAPATPTMQPKAPNLSLLHFFLQEGQVLQTPRFACIEDKAEIHAC